MLTRAFANLLRNAIQHSPSGSQVRVRSEERGENVVLIVEDPGVTLTDEVAQRVFTAAGQAEAKVTMGNGRYIRGLGLFAAAAAAGFAGARVATGAPPPASGNRFELSVPRHRR
jgi:K+-sensing histidine kinase KdpD